MSRLFTLVVSFLLALGVLAVPAAAAPVAVSGAGRALDFIQGWKFALVNTTGADAPQPVPGDSSWRDVRLPHDWSIGLNPVKGPDTTAGTAFLPGGLGWYRKTFRLPRALAGKQVSIEFDGVYMDSEVYLNGRLLGNHPYGYTGFSYDMTPYAHTDGTPDVLAVKVRNQVPSSRWYSGSGIYRNVRLVVTDPVHVTRHGLVVTTPDLENTIKSGFATVHVDTTAVNVRGEDRQAQVVSTVKNAEGRVVGSGSTRLGVGAEPRTAGVDVRITHPTLWSTERPYLYTVETQVLLDGRRTDSTSTELGIRWFAFDPAKGFSLNGKAMKLQGVNLHHDLGALGSAVHTDAIVRQLTIMKSMGINAVRTSHNPPAPELIRACARMGILMQVEAFDAWRTPKNPYDYARFFDVHSTADIQEMVRAARNSPAVVMWSIQVSTAGTSRSIRLTPDRKVLDDGSSLSFVTADVVDERGVVVPSADNKISFDVRGGTLLGLDNGQQESTENYQAVARKAFSGKAIAIVGPGQSPGPVVITARSPGLRASSTTLLSKGHGEFFMNHPASLPDPIQAADASYSGEEDTIPAAMLDGNTTSGGWSNYYNKTATALLHPISRSHAAEWVSVPGVNQGATSGVDAYFTTDAARSLPATITVSYWDGRRFVPVRGTQIEWATVSNQPTRISFEPVRTSRIRLDMTSRSPGTATGFLQIAELTVK